MKKVSLHTYGKLNLSIGITGVRNDGYHFVDMMMQTVSVFDTLTVCSGDKKGITITCNDPTLPTDSKNLAYRACEMFFKAMNLSFREIGVEIDIIKRIPHGGGMAGGSANAAGVLFGLNLLYGEVFTSQELCEIGVTLGADVPFCLTGGTARVKGIGEIITPVSPLGELYFVIAKPKEGVSTVQAFSDYDKVPHCVFVDNDEFIKTLEKENFKKLYPLMENALEDAVKSEEIEQLKRLLYEYGAQKSLMTGSGSCVFGVFESKKEALLCERKMKGKASFVAFATPKQKGIEVIQII